MTTDDRFYKFILDNLYDAVYCVDRDRTITYWNKGAERLTGYTADYVLGQSCKDGILYHVDSEGRPLCEGRCPVAKTIVDGQIREEEIFLHHKDGHRIPIRTRVAPLNNGGGRIVGAVEIFSDNSAKLAALQRISELEEKTLLDPLTGLANRRYIEMTLHDKLNEMARHGWAFGVLFIDLDHFKQINDRHGHDVGDKALRMVANTLLNNLRSYDVAGRWGGEEFIVVALHVNDRQLCAIAEKLRVLVARSFLHMGSTTIELTVSIGATLAERDDTPDGLVKRADRLMYRSKAAGRNCVTVGSGR